MELLRALYSTALGRPVRTIGLLSLIAIMAPLIFMAWLDYRGRCELAAAIAETDREWPRWRFEEILADQPRVPDEKNSALVIQAAHKRLEALNASDPEETEAFIDSTRWLLNGTEINHWGSAIEHPARQTGLDRRADVLQMTLSLRDLPNGHWEYAAYDILGYPDVPEGPGSQTHHLSGILRAYLQVNLWKNELDNCVDGIVCDLNLINSLRDVDGELGFHRLRGVSHRIELCLALRDFDD